MHHPFEGVCHYLHSVQFSRSVLSDSLRPHDLQHATAPRTVVVMPLTPEQATVNPHLHQRLLDTYRQVWVSLLWGHCSFLLGPDAHKILFVSSRSLFLRSCVSSGGFMVGLMATSSKRAYATPRSAAPRTPAHCGRPLLTLTSSGDTQTLQGRSGLVSVGSSGVHKVLFEPSERLW